MDFNVFTNFLINNFLFSFAIIIISFFLGWVLYNHIILRKISLRDSLFEKDNLAAWIEFIGAFIFPTLFLAAKAVEGSASENLLVDLGICIIYVVAYILLFTVLRLSSGLLVKLICAGDSQGKIDLNNEIYIQKNIAASLFSIVLSVIFVSLVRFLDVLPGYFLTSLFKMGDVLVFTLIAFIRYSLILRQKTTLLKEIFIDNNAAAGAAFLGFMFAVETILCNAVALQKEFDFVELIVVSFVGLAIFGILSAFFKLMFTKMIKVDIWNEVYEQNNLGAAIGQIALYIGIASVIVNFMK